LTAVQYLYLSCCRLIGCYEALDGGDLSEALADFTGGVSETTDLTNEAYQTDEDQRDRFYDWLSRAVDNNSLMCAAITVSLYIAITSDK